MQRTVETLASDAYEGRAPSTPVEAKVLKYLIAQMKAVGLKPGGEKGGWLHTVPTVELTSGKHTPITVGGLSLNYGDDYVAVTFREVPKTQITDAPMVFVGYGINAPELGWNDYAGVDMRGKVAVILINDADWMAQDETGTFKGRRMTYYGRWTYKFEEAARQGATGALIIHDTFPAAYGWNVVKSSWSGAQYAVSDNKKGMDNAQSVGWISQSAAQRLFATAGKDYPALVEAARHKGFAPVPLGVKASWSFDTAIRRSTSHNVVGILPGKVAPKEYVLYSAHWDHLGLCAPEAKGSDRFCHGAVDNATGVAALLALAKANVQAGPAARSQVFVALTLEESGLLGSEYYARHPLYPLAQTVGGVNMDALLPGGASRDYAMVGGDKSELSDIFRNVLNEQGLREGPEEHVERGHYYRSDHFSLAKRGVPMFDISRGSDLVAGGRAAGEAAARDYNEIRYHQPSDAYAPDWDWSGISQDVRLYYRLGRVLADGRMWPNWRPGDEFRAIRDASRKPRK
ncbi:M28 family peptidase [Novosphingobium sp. FSY-8]|uniref:M28 family peptidase n=2 Tax=Novosphingobium ovatum TaxID=1908523 RepID=A0ABW9XEM3_9SPHN|nr:M28 family peptidase [Novosphingobium ovatum]